MQACFMSATTHKNFLQLPSNYREIGFVWSFPLMPHPFAMASVSMPSNLKISDFATCGNKPALHITPQTAAQMASSLLFVEDDPKGCSSPDLCKKQ